MLTIIPQIKNHYTYSPSFQAYEKTFMMLKPDAFERKLNETIVQKIEENGLSILKEWEGVAPREKLEGNYSQYRKKSFFKDWIDFLKSGKIKAMLVGGDDAISKGMELRNKIRLDFDANNKRRNLLHSSDDIEAAEREIKNFFDVEV